MKKIIMAVLCSFFVIACSGGMEDGCCGWSTKEITGSGQIKRVGKITPIFCPDYYEADISMGVMRNGVGSMSTQDMFLFIEEKDVAALRMAVQSSAIIDFTYDERRFAWCVDRHRMTSFKIQK
jgi:hypothetical protein